VTKLGVGQSKKRGSTPRQKAITTQASIQALGFTQPSNEKVQGKGGGGLFPRDKVIEAWSWLLNYI